MSRSAQAHSDPEFSRQKLEALGCRTNGNCFCATAEALLLAPTGTQMVHGEVSHSQIQGLRYAHAWVEFEAEGITWCRDVSNGKDVSLPRELYYHLGQIRDEPGKLARYDRRQAARNMVESGHYGPWDLTTEL